MSADEKCEVEKPLNEVDDEIKKDKTFFAKLNHVKSNITVEPIFAGLIISSMLSRLAIQHLNLDKTCRLKLKYGDTICDALNDQQGNYSTHEAEVQKIIYGIEAWKSIIQTAIPTLAVIYMGAWSDRSGNRKICILLPIFGEFMVCLTNILSTYFFYDVSVEVTMFLEAIFPAITGGWAMVYLGVFSYISDITNEKSRTFRIGLANFCKTGSIPIGTALSGILLKFWGYYGIFFISGSIYLIIFMYGLFYLDNNTKPHASNEKSKSLKCIDVVNLVKETGEVAFKTRQSNYRTKIIMTLLIVAIVYGPTHGERLILYMYVRYRLKWDALKYSIFLTYGVITHSLGALFSISLFSKRWGWHDSVLCLISVVSKLAGSIFLVLVYTDFQMYMVPAVEILDATTFTSLRSMASKLVPSEELGKMNSLFSIVETLAALAFDPTYSTIYAKTISTFSGTVYVFSALMTLPAISILLWLFIQHRREVKQNQTRVYMKNEEELCMCANVE